MQIIKDLGNMILRMGRELASKTYQLILATGMGVAAYFGVGEIVSWVMPIALLPASPIVTFIAGGVFGLVMYAAWASYRSNIQSQINLGKYREQYEKLRKHLELNERKEFNLLDYNPEYLSAATELLIEKFRADENFTLGKICIKPGSVSDLRRLMRAGLNRVNARHLEICDTILGEQLVNQLHAEVMADRFTNIETLILRNNNIPPSSLENLNEIGRKLKIRALDISGNNLIQSIKCHDPLKVENKVAIIDSGSFYSFIKDFYQNFSSVKRLVISNINHNSADLSFISDLWAHPSLLESIDISENGMGPTILTPLLRKPEFQYNVSIREIHTGSNDSNTVKAAIDSREERIQRLRTALGETSATKIVPTIHILESLDNASDRPLPTELTQFLLNSMPSNGTSHQSVGDKWKLFFEKFKAFQMTSNAEVIHENSVEQQNTTPATVQIEDLFIHFRRSRQSDQEHLIENALRTVVTAQAKETIVLSLRHPNVTGSFDSIRVVEKLLQGLATLSRFEPQDFPVIQSVNFQNIGITSTNFSNLLAAGLGDYGTVELILENNRLDDTNIAELARHDSTAFLNLNSLNLSKNAISANSLEALSDFCRKVRVESLNISGNTLCNPAIPSSVQKVGQFLASLHYRIPTLKKLNISDIGLTSESLSILNPLIQNMSLLEEVDASQATIKRNMDYVNFYKQPDYLNNFFLKRFDMGGNSLKNIRTQTNIRENLVQAFKDILPQTQKAWPTLSILLTDCLMVSPL